MKIKESPALTRVLVTSSKKQIINLLKEQISELKQQKKCYDKMIIDREKAIKKLESMIFEDKRNIAVEAVKKAMKDCCTEDNPCNIHKPFGES